MLKEPDALKSYYRFCLQGNLAAALKIDESSARVSSPKLKLLIKRVSSRFIDQTESLRPRYRDSFAKEVITEFRKYYSTALLFPKRREEAESNLESKIWSIILERGHYSLWGRVTPYRSLLVWKRQDSRIFTVRLLSGQQRVKVVLLSGFVEQGWLHFATFGKHSVGGWAEKDSLYCIVKAYKNKFDGEAFRVSFLCHEAQHFYDNQNFPKLKQAELEYRAKLAELIAAKHTKRLISKFQSEANRDPKLPHSYASWRVLKDIDSLTRVASIPQRAAYVLKLHTLGLKRKRKMIA